MDSSRDMNEPLLFKVSPRHTKDGFNVSSEALGFVMWHPTLNDSIDYAKARSGGRAACIEVSNDVGQIVQTIEVKAEHSQ
jgi:hypothetical protein